MATMATSGMPSTLSIPAADDTMEISSDAGRGDQDIDIDFMGSEHGDNDVDWMLQDAASERGNPQAQADQSNNDDLMYDDGDEISYVEEDTMQDDAAAYAEAHPEAHPETADLEIDFDPRPATEETLYDATQDVDVEGEQDYEQPEEETLIDFETFSEHGDEQVVDEQPTRVEEAAEPAASVDDATYEANETQPDDYAEQTEVQFDEADPSWNEREAQAADPNPATDNPHQAEAQDGLPGQEGSHLEPSTTNQASASEALSRQDSPALEQPSTCADVLEQDFDNVQQQDAPVVPGSGPSVADASAQTPSAAIHPITVFYGTSGLEYSLFSTSEHDDPNTYLLQDTSVASSTLTNLFRACRSVLDQDLNEDIELEFYIDSLQLTISEDSIHCRDTSLAQIVEVYVDLQHNDGVEVVPALYMELITKDRFSAQLTSLFRAASEKKGLYALGFYQDEPQQEGEQLLREDEEQGTEKVPAPHQDDGAYAEAEEVENATADENVHEEASASAPEIVQDSPTQAEESNSKATENPHDAAQQSEKQPQDNYYQQAMGYQVEGQEQGEDDQVEQAQEEDHQDVAEGVEQGDGGSSRSSTIQGENKPESSRGYSPSLDEEEWLIDYDDEDNDIDASSETAQAYGHNLGREKDAAGGQTETNDFGAIIAEEEAGESYNVSGEHSTESYDEATFDADTFNHEFDENTDYTDDLEHHEGAQQGLDQADGQQDWAYDETQYELDTAPTQGSGTFQVPSSTEDDEDEITFNDDEFTLHDEQTQDTAVQEQTTDSPLGKRGREDEDDGGIDGSDQESKRLKAA